MGFKDHSRPQPTMTSHILLLLLASSVLGDPDSLGRQPQHRRRLCSLGTCQTHRLPEMIYWLRSAATKELSGNAGREPQDPHSYGRRRRREARVLHRLQDPGLKKRVSAVPSLLGDDGHVSGPPLASAYPSVYGGHDPRFLFP